MNLIVVCHQLRSPDNLGAIARVMANFGFSELILSQPATHDFRGVERLGVKADDVLKRFAVAATLEESLQGAVYAVGTSSRRSFKRRTPLTPEQGVERLAAHSARGKVALVLGGEKRGLSDEELAQCHDIVVIDTPGPQPSMNIAQAAAVLVYLCARGAAAAPIEPIEAGAQGALLTRLEARLREVLLACDFLNPQAPDHVLKELLRCLVHGRLSQREAQLWLAAFEHVGRVLGQARPADLVASTTASAT